MRRSAVLGLPGLWRRLWSIACWEWLSVRLLRQEWRVSIVRIGRVGGKLKWLKCKRREAGRSCVCWCGCFL